MRRRPAMGRWSVPVLGIVVTIVTLILLSGCSSASTTNGGLSSATSRQLTSPSASSPSPKASPLSTSEPVTSRWPPWLAAAVLNRAGGFSVIGPQGVIFEELRSVPQPDTTVTVRGPVPISNEPISGLILSGNQKLLAYVFPEEDLVVRSVGDGKILRRVAFTLTGSTTFRALSDDGRFVVVAPTTGSVLGEPGGQTPWALTIVDLADGKQTVAASLAALVKTRLSRSSSSDCGLVGVRWLPQDRLLVGLSGHPYETYIYDPATDVLQLVPHLQYVFAVSSDGVVLGEDMEAGRVIVWHDGTTEPVVPDKAWPAAGDGTISADGKVLALMMHKAPGKGMLTDPHGWQIFTRVGSEWRPAGHMAQINWINQPPGQTSGDGKVAWTIISPSTSQITQSYLLSHDFKSGNWEEWFRQQDMRTDIGAFSLAALIPSD